MLRNIINKIVSWIKGEKFELDPRIPLNYLLSFFSKQGIDVSVWNVETSQNI